MEDFKEFFFYSTRKRKKMSKSSAAADLWTLIENDTTKTFEDDSVEATSLFVGDSGCGKSYLIQSFLKPTVTKDPKVLEINSWNQYKSDNCYTASIVWNLLTFGCVLKNNLKPTFALEYSFARKKASGNSSKTVAHVWELGGTCSDCKDNTRLDFINLLLFKHGMIAIMKNLISVIFPLHRFHVCNKMCSWCQEGKTIKKYNLTTI